MDLSEVCNLNVLLPISNQPPLIIVPEPTPPLEGHPATFAYPLAVNTPSPFI